MLVYRVAQPKEGETYPIGPYHYYQWPNRPEVIESMLDDHMDSFHPLPWEEQRGFEMAEEQVCAFADLESLTNWFMGYEQELHELGFGIYTYEVPESAVIEFTYQCIVSADHMTLIMEHSI